MHSKKVLICKQTIGKILLVMLSLCILFVAGVNVTAEEISISSPSAILIEAGTGEVLFEKDAHIKLPPASVTKIMTMLLTIEAIDSGKIKPDDMVTCTEEAAQMGGSQVYLEPGEKMTVNDMLKAVTVASGNDAAVALAGHLAGSHEGFVVKMNERAKELGMKNTNFINCNGLDDPNHYTTAYDIALMSKELISHPKIFDFTSIWMDSLRDGSFGLVNTNKLIRFYEGANGLKTGSTSSAKYCISASAKRDNMDLIAVILAAPSSKDRFSDATKLLDYGFANYAVVNNLINEEDLKDIKVLKGEESTVKAGAKTSEGVLVAKDNINSIEKKTNITGEVKAPVKKGQKLGEVEFFIGNKKVGGTEIVATTDVGKINVLQMFGRLFDEMVTG